jgi:hypothetical protein
MATIPAGYGIWSITWTVAGTARNVTCTIAYDAPSDFTAAPANAAFRTCFLNTAGRPFSAGNLPTTYTVNETKALYNLGGTLWSDSIFSVTSGTGTTTPPPINTAVLVNKVTGMAGRRMRGRLFCPPVVPEANVNQVGIIDGAQVTAQQALWDAAYTAIVAAGYPPVILHNDGGTPTPVTSFSVQQRIGTTGRRLRG